MANGFQKRERRIRRIVCAAALCVAVGGCVSMPRSDIRADRIEAAVVPMAVAALDAGQTGTAQRLYGKLLDVDPESVPARMGLGDVAMAEHAPARAAEAYLAAAEAAAPGPERHAALLALGRAAVAAADLGRARQSFERLADPAEAATGAMAAWGFNGIGAVRLLEGDLKAAAAFVAVAVAENPDEPRFRANLDFLRQAMARGANADGAADGREVPEAPE